MKIAILGLPGSGKSTFALKLGEKHSIPVHHLDDYVFDGKVKREKQEFLTMQDKLLQGESWILEGCALSSLERRYPHSDMVIYFQLPRALCIWRAFKRYFQEWPNKVFNWALVKYTWNFERDQTAKIEALKMKHPEVEFILFTSSEDAQKFLL
jgi:adenylate kinase family enzyme